MQQGPDSRPGRGAPCLNAMPSRQTKHLLSTMHEDMKGWACLHDADRVQRAAPPYRSCMHRFEVQSSCLRGRTLLSAISKIM